MKLTNFSQSNLKKILFLVVISIIFNVNSVNVTYASVPEMVRIGLYFNDSQTGQYTALSKFEVDAEYGIQLGIFEDNKFTPLVQETLDDTVTISKDVIEESTEAYHIKISEGYDDYDSLIDELYEINKKGIDAYPAYVDEWQIWGGVYADENEAKDAMEELELDEDDYSLVKPSSTRIVTLSDDAEVLLMFDSSEGVFHIRPDSKNTPKVLRINRDDEKRFRGSFEVKRLTDSDMTLVNILPLEEYLYGVVPYEIQASSHPEALKAQAVAARTYSINSMYKYERLGFGMCTTVNSQVYNGYDGEAEETNKAIDDTKGQIVTYNGSTAAVFYFSSSGGRTEDVKNVWGGNSYPYLVSVEDKYESGTSWRYEWEVSYTAQRINEIMIGRGFDLGNIRGINITKRSEAGRAIELVVNGSRDKRVYTNGNTRNFLSLDSQWFDITTDADVLVKTDEDNYEKTQLAGKKVMTSSGLKTIGNDVSVVSAGNKKTTIPAVPTIYTFTGRGWGHAVGMSQEGAKGMADNGYKYEEILSHYFPGTEIE
ncbi:SpoIID/LytB domain-containing protein [Herbivorax sp. ANBcel31]|uniref:SpoIID/LytB domain-containing protein n=1 Tax=Herbivorax sp. ANBcel31 TaxID=3069754 RepID=UPI0027B73533|nr:SpoIID/LytB domain-containing protein [Herbivorax sp. ANBcel31]MDQ2085225.1 SpoIID/LytB domain-containing protein [Herbivorax sp. ANBcel31]